MAESEDEAIYLVGLLNSRALSEAIMDFQSQGEFGRRHIHTLPYKIMPRYDSENPNHADFIETTKLLMDGWKALCRRDSVSKMLEPNSGNLNSRRKRLRIALRTLDGYSAYENACKSVLGVGEDNAANSAIICQQTEITSLMAAEESSPYGQK